MRIGTSSYLRTLYRVDGWIEIAIAADPECEGIVHKGWHWYSEVENRKIASLLEELADEGNNVFISPGTFKKKQRRIDLLNPSHVLIADDVGAEVECSYLVETSPSNHQAYFLVDAPLAAHRQRELRSRIQARFVGSDKSFKDPTHLIRTPGCWNTKAKCGSPFQVRFVEQSTGEVYSIAEIESMFPPAGKNAAASDFELEQFFGLEPLEGYFEECRLAYALSKVQDGVPRRIGKADARNGNNESYRVFVGKGRGGSSSENRATAIKGMLMVGYPPDVVAAEALKKLDFGASKRKGRRWLLEDVRRLIKDKLTELMNESKDGSRKSPPKFRYDNEHERGCTKPVQLLNLGSPGRKTKLTPEGLYAFYLSRLDIGNRVMLSVAEAAAALSVSKSLVSACEKELRERGLIDQRVNYAGNRASYVPVLGGDPEAATPRIQPMFQPLQHLRTSPPVSAHEPSSICARSGDFWRGSEVIPTRQIDDHDLPLGTHPSSGCGDEGGDEGGDGWIIDMPDVLPGIPLPPVIPETFDGGNMIAQYRKADEPEEPADEQRPGVEDEVEDSAFACRETGDLERESADDEVTGKPVVPTPAPTPCDSPVAVHQWGTPERSSMVDRLRRRTAPSPAAPPAVPSPSPADLALAA